jgi:hypothetical protein
MPAVYWTIQSGIWFVRQPRGSCKPSPRGSSARTELCGGRAAMPVPTATRFIIEETATGFDYGQSEANGCWRDDLSCAEPRELPFPAVPRNCAFIKAAISRCGSSPAVTSRSWLAMWKGTPGWRTGGPHFRAAVIGRIEIEDEGSRAPTIRRTFAAMSRSARGCPRKTTRDRAATSRPGKASEVR